jgi:sterol desaturase/sphingolipid hydroxylase (fatty acid hydroxylase superfamily)
MWKGIIDYFQELENHPVQRMAMLVAGLLIFWIIEGAIPLLPMSYKKNKTRHAVVNFGFTIIHLVIHTGIAVLIVLLSDWCKQQSFGIVYWFHANILFTILISILALDFSSWVVHWIMHKVRPLWAFHLVHHTDNNVDVTTGLRHHPGDSILRGLFFLLLIFVSGAPVYGVMIYQTLLVLTTAFTHANIRLPAWLDRGLGYLLISPNMHKVHHHWKQPFTDSNYGAVFSFWDRLFGTYRKLDASQIHYGLDRYYPNEKDEDFVRLLKKPFEPLDH